MNNIKTQNRAFEKMRKPALARLQGKNAEVLAENTGISYDKNQQIFSLESLGEKIGILYPKYEITPKLNDWHHLLILHYIDMADGAPLSGQLMTFGELPGATVRGGGFDRQSERDLGLQFGNCPPDLVGKACKALGAEIFESNGILIRSISSFSLLSHHSETLVCG